MHPAFLVLCLCIWDPALSTSISKTAAVETKQPIGENVTAKVVVFYDSAYLGKTKPDTGSNSDGSKSFQKYFEQLFQEVESHFHNHSIKIKLQVQQVKHKNDFSTYSGAFNNEKEMLENLTTYGQSLGLPRNTIFFRFTWSEKKFIGTSSRPLSQSATETDGTFCTSNTSAAIILHDSENQNPWSTIKATSSIFGSKHFFNFSRQDWRTLNETFSRCPKGENLDIVAC